MGLLLSFNCRRGDCVWVEANEYDVVLDFEGEC